MIKPFVLAAGGIWESIAEWYQGSVIYELLKYFEEKYFSIPFERYDNFTISTATGINIRNIIVSIAIGIIIAGAMIAHTRSCHGSFVRRLLRNDCTSPEKAKTLSELGFFHNISVRIELKKGVTLRKLVYCKEEQESKKEESFIDETQSDIDTECTEENVQEEIVSDESTEKAEETIKEKEPFITKVKKWLLPKKHSEGEFEVDCSTMHFYIPEDLRYRADIRYERKGSGWLPFVLVSIATIVASAIMCVYMPNLLHFADNMISFFSPN